MLYLAAGFLPHHADKVNPVLFCITAPIHCLVLVCGGWGWWVSVWAWVLVGMVVGVGIGVSVGVLLACH